MLQTQPDVEALSENLLRVFPALDPSGRRLSLALYRELAISVAEIVGLYSADAANQDLLRKASELSALPEGWRDYFRKRLWEPDA